MSYRLKPTESISHGLRRIARKQLKSAAAYMESGSARDKAVHEARKSLKKVRAVLDVVEADGGRRLADSKKRLRKINRTLSPLRDAAASLEILGKLAKRNPALFTEFQFGRLRRHLTTTRRAAARSAARENAPADSAREFRKLRRLARRWRPKHSGFGVLAEGLRSTYRAGRKAGRRARKTGREEDFHEWRKRLKALWYQLRLIEGCNPLLRREVKALHRAETVLGEDHNLTVLCSELADAPVPINANRLGSAVERYRKTLRKKASASLKRFFERKTSAFLHGVERDWMKWSRCGPLGGKRQKRKTA